MSDDNIINVDFARHGVEEQVRDLLVRAAKQRGYSPDRAGEIASIICATGEEMTRGTISIDFTVPTPASDDDVKAAVDETARLAVRQTVHHCQRQFLSAVLDLCYPKSR